MEVKQYVRKWYICRKLLLIQPLRVVFYIMRQNLFFFLKKDNSCHDESLWWCWWSM